MSENSLSELAHRVQTLTMERAEHMAAIESIDETLARVAQILGSSAAAARGSGEERQSAPAATEGGAPKGKKGRKRGRGRGRFETSAEESIMEFVRARRNPTTTDVKHHYEGEGRGGKADNILSKLVRDGKLRREPIEGQRGSHYLLA